MKDQNAGRELIDLRLAAREPHNADIQPQYEIVREILRNPHVRAVLLAEFAEVAQRKVALPFKAVTPELIGDIAYNDGHLSQLQRLLSGIFVSESPIVASNPTVTQE